MEAPEESLRVLFVGNSPTYVNDLPAMVAQMALATGSTLEYEAITRPNFSLEDHWALGLAPTAIRGGDWDYVVMQQGPSSLPESRENLVEWGSRFAQLIHDNGGRPAFYMVWPSSNRPGDRDGVRTSYTAAANATDGVLAPAGEAWRAAWRRDQNLALYDPDGVHGSRLGTYLAAVTVYEQLFRKSPLQLPAPSGMSPSTAQLLHEAAAEADAEYGRR